jgi:hypothetical protein
LRNSSGLIQDKHPLSAAALETQIKDQASKKRPYDEIASDEQPGKDLSNKHH